MINHGIIVCNPGRGAIWQGSRSIYSVYHMWRIRIAGLTESLTSEGLIQDALRLERYVLKQYISAAVPFLDPRHRRLYVNQIRSFIERHPLVAIDEAQ